MSKIQKDTPTLATLHDFGTLYHRLSHMAVKINILMIVVTVIFHYLSFSSLDSHFGILNLSSIVYR